MTRPCDCRFVCERPDDCPRVEWSDPEATPAADVRAYLDRVERKPLVVSDAAGPCPARVTPENDARAHVWDGANMPPPDPPLYLCRYCGGRRA